jgi:hypothetical protein
MEATDFENDARKGGWIILSIRVNKKHRRSNFRTFLLDELTDLPLFFDDDLIVFADRRSDALDFISTFPFFPCVQMFGALLVEREQLLLPRIVFLPQLHNIVVELVDRRHFDNKNQPSMTK